MNKIGASKCVDKISHLPMISRILSVLVLGLSLSFGSAQKQPPNVLIISIDDLNDWVGGLNGHPQTLTPNIDRLAARGVRFDNAHCQAPVCNPSRASLGVSLYPSTTGIYFLNPDIMQSKVAKKIPTFPIHFQTEGYAVSGAGKLFHGASNKIHLPNWAGPLGGMGPLPKKKLTTFSGHRLWDWGTFPETDEQTPDHKIADWGIDALKKADKKKPFFLVTGFYRPHVPHYAPKKWMDKIAIESTKLPVIKKDDLKDLSPYAISLTRDEHVAPTHKWVVENKEWKNLVHTYLACVHFVDHQVGKVLDALDESGHADNTIVVLLSDHGFHLGEKERWAKRSLWEDSTRIPLIMAGPGIVKGKACKKPAELIDIYPTLMDLTGLKAPANLEGNSLLPLLKNPTADWPHMARTEFGPKNYSIRSERYRYIHYADGSEEFYDLNQDEHEWNNLIKDVSLKNVIAKHREHAPKTFHEVLGQKSTGHKCFGAANRLITIDPAH